eukprot:CAMPEP_0172467240 /NCGR_PEP_ID=MMETSP1065-20121228/58315_1 /TAXON_ID=265537 /ORGANISM="Amphiprora paludosa, Strain CCMP125" /LENGTH=78 /DNA_ID=CAMNT_0013224327 /DNA_START=52 /DNA_END=285 /DNA_ORIENTATION=+
MNPLLSPWTTQPFNLPPFKDIQTEHFKPALEEGMTAHLEDLKTIIDNDEEPTFENVIVPYDRAGGLLDKVSSVYGNMC